MQESENGKTGTMTANSSFYNNKKHSIVTNNPNLSIHLGHDSYALMQSPDGAGASINGKIKRFSPGKGMLQLSSSRKELIKQESVNSNFHYLH